MTEISRSWQEVPDACREVVLHSIEYMEQGQRLFAARAVAIGATKSRGVDLASAFDAAWSMLALGKREPWSGTPEQDRRIVMSKIAVEAMESESGFASGYPEPSIAATAVPAAFRLAVDALRAAV